jgi:hypothetical protein
MDDPVSELRGLGLTVEIDQATATRIWAELLSVHGHLLQGHYHKHHHPESGHVKTHFYEAYHAIARGVVKRDTSDEVLERMIPTMVDAFKVKHEWLPKVPLDVLARWLEGPIIEWKGKRLLMQSENPVTVQDAVSTPSGSREERLQRFTKERGIPIARVERSADVDGKNMDQWRRDEMKDTSVMAERIEDVLAGRRPLKA